MWVCSNCKNENSDKKTICVSCGSSREEQMQPDMLLEGVGHRNRGERSIDLADMDLEPTPFSEKKRKDRPERTISETEVLTSERTGYYQEEDDSWEATVVLKQPGEEGYEEQEAAVARDEEKRRTERDLSSGGKPRRTPAPSPVPGAEAPKEEKPFVKPKAPEIPPDLSLEDLSEPKSRKGLIIGIASAIAVGVIIFLIAKGATGKDEGKKSAKDSATATTQTVTIAATTAAATTEATEAVTEPVTEAKKEGWVEEGGKTYFYYEDGTFARGWMESSGVWYYFMNDGSLRTGWFTLEKKRYHADDRGILTFGHAEIDGKWYYFNKRGQMETGWKTVDDKYAYFRLSNGTQVFGEWIEGYWLDKKTGLLTYEYKAEFKQDEKGTWFGDESGWYARNETLVIDGKSYTFDKKGYVVK